MPAPNTLPADFFKPDQSSAPSTLPADFFQGQKPQAQPQAQGGGFWDAAGKFIGGAIDTLNPLPALYRYGVQPTLDLAQSIHDRNGAQFVSAVERIANPGQQMVSDVANAQLNQAKQAVDEAKKGHYVEAAGRAGAAVLPIVGPAAAQAGETIGNGDIYRGAGQAAGLIASVVAPPMVAPKVAAVMDKVPTAQGAVAAGVDKVANVVGGNPRPLSPEATALAQKYNVPLTQGMAGGSRAVQAAEKTLGHSLAPDIYEPLLQDARQGVSAGAKYLSGGFATDKFTAGQNIINSMIDAAQDHESTAAQEYSALHDHEANPDNTRNVQVGMKANPNLDPAAPDQVPDIQPVPLPVDMRPVKAAVAPFVDEIQRRMTPAQRKADPGLAALQNILTRPDALPASTAEADLGFLKDIQRSEATPQAKRLATVAANALQPAIDAGVSIAGPEALESLQTARGSWAARSSILDELKSLANDTNGREGQVLLVNKLLQPADASFPALERVLNVAPGAAEDLGKAYLTERVFKKVSGSGEDLTNPTNAENLWNQIGPRTKAALYTPQQISDINSFLELAKRVAENPNPSGTGTVNALIKMGALVTHPVGGGAAIALGRHIARVLYYPNRAQMLRTAIAHPTTPQGIAAARNVARIMAGGIETGGVNQTGQTSPPTSQPGAGTQ